MSARVLFMGTPDFAVPTLRALVDGLISPRAASYGFRRVLVHVRGLPGEPEDRRLIAEVTLTDAGRWITFRR